MTGIGYIILIFGITGHSTWVVTLVGLGLYALDVLYVWINLYFQEPPPQLLTFAPLELKKNRKPKMKQTKEFNFIILLKILTPWLDILKLKFMLLVPSPSFLSWVGFFIWSADAGKSTTGGQILFLSGQVDDRTIQKYEKEAKEKSRESW